MFRKSPVKQDGSLCTLRLNYRILFFLFLIPMDCFALCAIAILVYIIRSICGSIMRMHGRTVFFAGEGRFYGSN